MGKVSSLEVLRYLDSKVGDSLEVEIRSVVMDFHKCRCKDRLYSVEEIVNASDDKDPYADIFFRNGVIKGVVIASAMAKLITRRNIRGA